MYFKCAITYSVLLYYNTYNFNTYNYILLLDLNINICFFLVGTDEIYNTSWFAFQSLQFVLDKDVPKKTLNTVNIIIIFVSLKSIT